VKISIAAKGYLDQKLITVTINLLETSDIIHLIKGFCDNILYQLPDMVLVICETTQMISTGKISFTIK